MARKVVISIKNRLLSNGIELELKNCENLVPCANSCVKAADICSVLQADVFLAEVSAFEGEDLITRMDEVRNLKYLLPGCKSVLLVDDIAYPELAESVQAAKATGAIDGFLFTTVTASYLKAYLASV